MLTAISVNPAQDGGMVVTTNHGNYHFRLYETGGELVIRPNIAAKINVAGFNLMQREALGTYSEIRLTTEK